MNKISQHNQCIVCGSAKLKKLTAFQNNHLCKCMKCKMVFAQLIPTQAELDSYYKSYGTSHYISELTIKRYNELLDLFESSRKNNRILDIGCGVGFFLETAKKRGWDVYGTEFSSKLCSICNSKGIEMFHGSISGFKSEMKFDIITSFEVIEHINSPREELTNINKLLRKDGLFYCTTPNFNSIERYYLGERYNVISYPEHLSYYTPKTLNYLFEKHGLKKIWIKTTGISITRIKTSKGMSNERIISSQSTDEVIRGKIESNRILKLAKSLINYILTLSGSGMAMKGLYRKVDEISG